MNIVDLLRRPKGMTLDSGVIFRRRQTILAALAGDKGLSTQEIAAAIELLRRTVNSAHRHP